jgi:dUTPase
MAIGAGKIEKGHRIPLDVKVGDRIRQGCVASFVQPNAALSDQREATASAAS